MNDMRTDPGLLHRGWSRLLDGDRAWGSLEIHPDRFGLTRYRLVVFPPGINAAERRSVRVARGWPLWGAVVWVLCEVCLTQTTGPWTAVLMSTRSMWCWVWSPPPGRAIGASRSGPSAPWRWPACRTRRPRRWCTG